MPRIEIGRQGVTNTSILRNVRVKSRHSSLEEEITWDYNKGDYYRRPGRDRAQEKWVKDAPVMELLLPEYLARVEDSILVITRGWRLAEEEPVECWMGDLILDAPDRMLYLSAKVRSNNVATTCGFLVSFNRLFNPSWAIACDETPVTSADDEKINLAIDVSDMHGIDYYVLPFADDGTNIAFGIIKHIQFPPDMDD
jgi:hypothetical protein